MTPEQEQDQQRRNAYIERHGLVSRMNDTRWRAVLAALEAIPFYPGFRVRCIRDADDPGPRWEGSFPWHVPTFAEIEWLELQRLGVGLPHHRIDRSAEIVAALTGAKAPFEESAEALRIIGYTRPG